MRSERSMTINTDVAYLAGLYDGVGTVKSSETSIYLNFLMYDSDKEKITRAKAALAACGIPYTQGIQFDSDKSWLFISGSHNIGRFILVMLHELSLSSRQRIVQEMQAFAERKIGASLD